MVSMQGMFVNMLIMGNGKIFIFEKAMGAISLSSIHTFLQTKHWKEQFLKILDATMGENCKHLLQSMFKVLLLLSTNIGKDQLFIKFVRTKQVSLSSLQTKHVKEQLFNILHAMGEKVKHS
jgi:hypothetical protein